MNFKLSQSSFAQCIFALKLSWPHVSGVDGTILQSHMGISLLSVAVAQGAFTSWARLREGSPKWRKISLLLMARSQPVGKSVPVKWWPDFGPTLLFLGPPPEPNHTCACSPGLELHLFLPLCNICPFPALALCGPHRECACPLHPTKAQLPLWDKVLLAPFWLSPYTFQAQPLAFWIIILEASLMPLLPPAKAGNGINW